MGTPCEIARVTPPWLTNNAARSRTAVGRERLNTDRLVRHLVGKEVVGCAAGDKDPYVLLQQGSDCSVGQVSLASLRVA
jgi:hypothetical protein